jgi:hypothetical protein
MDQAPARYMIRINGHLGVTVLSAFPALAPQHHGGHPHWGAVAEQFPSTFPSGTGSDLAGIVEKVGAGVSGFSPGDEVIGFTNKRSSRAELVGSRPATPL